MAQGRVFIIAEAGVNHCGDLALAERLVDAAAEAGADCVKFQAFRANQLASRYARKAAYQIGSTGSDQSQVEMLKTLEIPIEHLKILQARAQTRSIAFLCSPFDESTADDLVALGMRTLKIASGELTNLPFLEHVAGSGCDLIVSTGMATLGEVEEALHTLQSAGATAITLLHCVSNYPTPPSEVNLRAMDTLRQAFHVPVGFSDHTDGIIIPLAAAARGAEVIEKHLTMDRRMTGPDHAASLEPPDFAAMVRGIREIESALGSGEKRPAPSEMATRRLVRKSLVAVRDLPAGHLLTAEDIVVRRPGDGLPPARRAWAIGRTLRRARAADEVLTEDDV